LFGKFDFSISLLVSGSYFYVVDSLIDIFSHYKKPLLRKHFEYLFAAGVRKQRALK